MHSANCRFSGLLNAGDYNVYHADNNIKCIITDILFCVAHKDGFANPCQRLKSFKCIKSERGKEPPRTPSGTPSYSILYRLPYYALFTPSGYLRDHEQDYSPHISADSLFSYFDPCEPVPDVWHYLVHILASHPRSHCLLVSETFASCPVDCKPLWKPCASCRGPVVVEGDSWWFGPGGDDGDLWEN